MGRHNNNKSARGQRGGGRAFEPAKYVQCTRCGRFDTADKMKKNRYQEIVHKDITDCYGKG